MICDTKVIELMVEVKIWSGYYSSRDCQRHPNALFVFGDNLAKHGYAGQATIRDESNAFGVPTCIAPRNAFSDNSYEDNCQRLEKVLLKLSRTSAQYDFVYFPYNGLGTGLAMLATRAPKTFQYLNRRLEELFGVKNGQKVNKVNI